MIVFIWIVIAFVAIVGIASTIMNIIEADTKVGKLLGAIVSIFVAGAIIAGCMWWIYGTEGGKRAIKSFYSDIRGGIERDVKVYDMDGDIIQEYQGRFDVEHDENRLLFDDENGKRHVVYYSTGTVVIDER